MTKIIVDNRELRSHVPANLEALGLELEVTTMDVGDYCLSERVGIERKTAEDFLSSFMVDRKLFEQLIDLINVYSRPILIIESENGLSDVFTKSGMRIESVQGIMNSIALLRLPVLESRSPESTAVIMQMIAEKEQSQEPKKEFHPHGRRSHRNPDEQLEYALSSLPDMGVVTSRNLLSHFKSILAIANSEKDELEKVTNVGKKTSSLVYDFMRRRYTK